MIGVLVVGLGPIGRSTLAALGRERCLKPVGMVDCDPSLIGKSAEDLGLGGENIDPSLRVCSTIDEAVAVAPTPPKVAVLATVSAFDQAASDMRTLLGHKLAVVSSCEQMLYPAYRHAELAGEIDEAAKQAGRAVLGTGVNPGFVMDALAVGLASMVRRVSRVKCVRVVNASLRRAPLQQKVGSGLTVKKFDELQSQGQIGHAGLCESVALLVAGLSRRAEPGSIKETLEPIIAEHDMAWAKGNVLAGQVRGIHNTAVWEGDDLTVELDLTMALGEENPRDKIKIDGPVPIFMKIPGGMPGDSATVAALLNHVVIVHRATPGLRTMLDIPRAGCCNSRQDV